MALQSAFSQGKMTVNAEQAKQISAHLAAHEAKIVKRRKARKNAGARKKKRGLTYAITQMRKGK